MSDSGGGRILVIRGGAIGDFVLTLPVLNALRQQFPEARLDVMGYPKIVALASLGGGVDGVVPIESRALAGFFARNGELDPALGTYFASCSIILSYLFDPDGIFQANVGRCSSAQWLQGPHRPIDAQGVPASQVLLKPLERLAIFGADPEPHLLVPPQPYVDRPGQWWLAAHPGSGSERKNWPESRWAALLERLARDPALHLLLVGGEAEGDRLGRLSRVWGERRIEVARDLPLPELARRLALCQGFIGHDSGITHIAAAVGLRGVALWGDSHEAVWRPPSPRMAVVRDPQGLDALTAERVEAELVRRGLTPRRGPQEEAWGSVRQ
jgi:ADP-heptose:LPS heptosyltransferase